MLYEFTSLLQSFSHSPKSCKKLPITILIGPVNEAFRIFQGLHLSRTGCTSDCCKILLWQVFAMRRKCCTNLLLCYKVSHIPRKVIKVNEYIKLLSVKFLKTTLSFMEFAQILKKLCRFKVAVDRIPSTNLHTVNLTI